MNQQNDSTKLIEYVEKILDDPNGSVLMGTKGRERVQKNFELSLQFEKIRKVVQNHIKSKKSISDL